MDRSHDPASAAFRAELARELVPGERLLWSGRPRGRDHVTGFAMWIFAIPWTVFALGWEAMALLPWFGAGKMPDMLRIGAGIVMPLFGLPFILVGFAMLATPFRAIRAAGRTIFAVTDRRLLRVSLGRKRGVTSVFLDRVGPIDTQESRDGWGTIKVQTHSRVDGDGDRVTERFEMIGIPEVARVRRLIVERQP